MFSMREFIKSGFLKSIGKMSDHQIILNAAGYCEKGILTEEDLSEIQTAMDEYAAKQAAVESPVVVTPEVQDITEEPTTAAEEPTTEEPTDVDEATE